ncbi:MAG: MarR family transcriptional regulator [Methanothrix sp.]|nr:MarR family transcriptional regulator [Methanothrix sp.]
MKIIRLLGVLAVLSLLMVPAISGNKLKSCACAPGICHGSQGGSRDGSHDSAYEKSCCSKYPNDSSFSKGCACPSDIAPISSTELYVYDPSNSNFSKGSSRSYSRQSVVTSLTYTSDAGACSIASLVNPNSKGPPDLYVVEYLPPSAKQVFNVLASDGPLTQKDLINKTDLPPRTVRYALDRLKGEDMLEERFCFRDARQILYSLNGIAPKSK